MKNREDSIKINISDICAICKSLKYNIFAQIIIKFKKVLWRQVNENYSSWRGICRAFTAVLLAQNHDVTAITQQSQKLKC